MEGRGSVAAAGTWVSSCELPRSLPLVILSVLLGVIPELWAHEDSPSTPVDAGLDVEV